jgi:hypothetical protein
LRSDAVLGAVLRQVEFDFSTTLLHSIDTAHSLDIYQGLRIRKLNKVTAAGRYPLSQFEKRTQSLFAITSKIIAVADLTFWVNININKQHLLPRHKRHLGCLADTRIVHFQNDRNSRLQVACGASVKRQKLTRTKVQRSPKGKPLSVRYAELLSLRREVLKALSEKQRTRPGRKRTN